MAGEGSDPCPKKPPAHAPAEHVQYIHRTHLPGAMAMCQFKLHIRDNFFSRTLCSKSYFLALWLNLHQLSQNVSQHINISNSDNHNSTTSSFELASAKARVTSVKSTKQQLVSELVSHWHRLPMIGLGSDKKSPCWIIPYIILMMSVNSALLIRTTYLTSLVKTGRSQIRELCV